ncbi:ABC transporter ATP-binding protein [Ketogulonicigenium vulgare]|uniref:ABC transporter, nucleotide binding/ATPase protein (Sugar) n=1 Tax=Ketogulonicigenium vulgare (strain WSH-001) TaxID=759362 RepID=F9YA72_KETVW|nr:sn-glycerol-3-phosphate ABC transporter ATP-binding protein UgpC [Ketogulonicigenium vulgare]ADO43189.1 ATP-binding transport protein smoK [Ketogulonicigenium vulgare Y25]AEM41483.1 ABC transporter, nucleotide binding/ATPase protein (Sugar) [Ketogulonicigenium vulgare WSH-001]ALJ81616.1 sugar ABC transporter ATP-binding protein [Ketogulonicigenium vulgare]ANW34292.1 sugar ABC transporter ATP-binding protein [Ketogulonicigenium vulgare]AOZ55225.1 ATP-binding transport protein smoK [Ketogulon
MAKIELEGLVKDYGKVRAVHGIDLQIEDGEFVVFVGPSGCGKSTTLRMIAGLEDISGGALKIGGKVVNQLEPKQRNIAMVFQNYAIYPHMTVGQNIAFGLYTSKLPKAEKDRLVREAGETLGLTPYLDRRPAALSGGQRQRVAIGRAMVRSPSAFLFDEPLSNLDAQLRGQMRIEIKRLHQRLGTTIVYVTHDQVEAMTMADKIVVMRDGRILQVGSPLDLYENPVDVFTARFIGSPSMNVIEGESDGVNLRLGNSTLPGFGANLPAGKVMVGLRPHDLKVGVPGDATLEAVVTAIEPLGAETLVHMEVAGQPLVGSAPGRVLPVVGSTVTASVTRGVLYVFDAQTEKALGRA